MEVNIGSVLYNRTVTMGEKIGFVHRDSRLTFTEMNERANSFSAFLKRSGLLKGNTIAIICKNNEKAIAAFFGAAKIGIVSVMVNWRLQTEEMQYILSHSDVKMIVYDEEFQSAIDKLRARLPEMIYVSTAKSSSILPIWQQSTEEPVYESTGSDPILILYTSGTTGKPKGVLLSHNNLLASSVGLSHTNDWVESDRFLMVTPFFHVVGFAPMIRNINLGATMILMEDFDPVEAWKTIEEEQVTKMMTVHSMLASMSRTYPMVQSDFSSLRNIICRASIFRAPLMLSYKEMGIPIQRVYDMTEYTGVVTIEENYSDKHDSLGKPVKNSTIEIVDCESKEKLPNGEIGEIVISGPQLFVGYHKNEETYMQSVVDGKFYTGDVGYLDEGGFLHVIDRLKDMIISGGEKIYSAELESALLKHPAIADVAVVGAPNEMLGEIPRAFIVRNDGFDLTKEEVIVFSREKLASYMAIKEVTFIDQLPQNAVGKVMKQRLRDMAAVL